MSTSSLSEIKNKLYELEKARLEKQYPHENAWRAPRNIADSMGCVGTAMYQLQDYASMLESLSADEVIKLYEAATLE